MRAARKTAPLCLGVALALTVSACGGSASTSSSTAPAAPATSTTTAAATTASTEASSTSAASTAPTAHVSIVSPRAGAHTGSTLTVHVAVSGAPSNSAQRLRYVLDGTVNRSGPAQLTFHDLAPGRHRLEVLIDGGSARASTTFTVRAPAAVPVSAATPPPTTTPAAASPVHATEAPAPVHTSPPAQTHTTPPPKPAPAPAPPAKTTPATSNEGIPQGPNAGDGDGDNHGEPSDGDGDI